MDEDIAAAKNESLLMNQQKNRLSRPISSRDFISIGSLALQNKMNLASSRVAPSVGMV